MMTTDDLLIASLIRYAITQWLERHDTSPLTGLHLASKRLTPNKEVRAAVAKDWHARAHHDAPLHFPTGARRGGKGARGCHQGHQGPPRWSAFTSSLDP